MSKMQTKNVPFVDLRSQYQTIAGDVDAAIRRVIQDTDFILGEAVEAFEEDFARYCGTSYAVGVDSGTSALELALRAYEIGPGDEVITAANTFIATALAITYTGATPVLVDVEPETFTMDVSQVEKSITRRTKAILPVHLYGHPADMDAIMDVAARYELVVIEDACQAHGASYKGRPAGSIGHAAAFSFYPGKNLGAFGDGGAVVTNDEKTAAALRMLRNYGQKEKYHHLVHGFNKRLDTLQAALLDVKLKRLDGWNNTRREHAKMYNGFFKSNNGNTVITPPSEAEHARSNYHLYVIQVEKRDQLQAHLQREGIATGIHYPIPIHMQPAYSSLGYPPGAFPVTERTANRILSLPMYAELTPDMVAQVAGAVNHFAMTETAAESGEITL